MDSVESAVAAEAGGATRLELCADLQVGGTTPGLTLFRHVRRNCGLPVNVLLRPRFGDFCYTAHELAILRDDAALFAGEGANGLVLGALLPDGSLDTQAIARMISCARGCPVTLHRAFDLCADPYAALEQAAMLGVSSILTSGQKSTALEGAPLLHELHRRAAGRLDILAGGGVNRQTVTALAAASGTRAYHMSGKRTVNSPMTYRKEGVPMGLPLMSEYELWRTDTDEVAAVRRILENL